MTPETLASRLNWMHRRMADIDLTRDVADPATARLLDTVRRELESLCRDVEQARHD